MTTEEQELLAFYHQATGSGELIRFSSLRVARRVCQRYRTWPKQGPNRALEPSAPPGGRDTPATPPAEPQRAPSGSLADLAASLSLSPAALRKRLRQAGLSSPYNLDQVWEVLHAKDQL